MFNNFKDQSSYYSRHPTFQEENHSPIVPKESPRQTSAPPWDLSQPHPTYSYCTDQHLPVPMPALLQRQVVSYDNASSLYHGYNNNNQHVLRPKALITCQTNCSRAGCCKESPQVPQHWSLPTDKSSENASKSTGCKGLGLSQPVSQHAPNVEGGPRTTINIDCSVKEFSRFPRDITGPDHLGINAPQLRVDVGSQQEASMPKHQLLVTGSDNASNPKKDSSLQCQGSCAPNCQHHDRQNNTFSLTSQSQLNMPVGLPSVSNQWLCDPQTRMWTLPTKQPQCLMPLEGVKMTVSNPVANCSWLDRREKTSVSLSAPNSKTGYQDMFEYQIQQEQQKKYVQHYQDPDRLHFLERMRYQEGLRPSQPEPANWPQEMPRRRNIPPYPVPRYANPSTSSRSDHDPVTVNPSIPPSYPYSHSKMPLNYVSTGPTQYSSRFSSAYTQAQSKSSNNNFNPHIHSTHTANLISSNCIRPTIIQHQPSHFSSNIEMNPTQVPKGLPYIPSGQSYNNPSFNSCSEVYNNVNYTKTMQVVDKPCLNTPRIIQPYTVYDKNINPFYKNLFGRNSGPVPRNMMYDKNVSSRQIVYDPSYNTNNVQPTMTQDVGSNVGSFNTSSQENINMLGTHNMPQNALFSNVKAVSQVNADAFTPVDSCDRPIKKRKSQLADYEKPLGMDLRQFIETWEEESEEVPYQTLPDSDSGKVDFRELVCSNALEDTHDSGVIKLYQSDSDGNHPEGENVSTSVIKPLDKDQSPKQEYLDTPLEKVDVEKPLSSLKPNYEGNPDTTVQSSVPALHNFLSEDSPSIEQGPSSTVNIHSDLNSDLDGDTISPLTRKQNSLGSDQPPKQEMSTLLNVESRPSPIALYQDVDDPHKKSFPLAALLEGSEGLIMEKKQGNQSKCEFASEFENGKNSSKEGDSLVVDITVSNVPSPDQVPKIPEHEEHDGSKSQYRPKHVTSTSLVEDKPLAKENSEYSDDVADGYYKLSSCANSLTRTDAFVGPLSSNCGDSVQLSADVSHSLRAHKGSSSLEGEVTNASNMLAYVTKPGVANIMPLPKYLEGVEERKRREETVNKCYRASENIENDHLDCDQSNKVDNNMKNNAANVAELSTQPITSEKKATDTLTAEVGLDGSATCDNAECESRDSGVILVPPEQFIGSKCFLNEANCKQDVQVGHLAESVVTDFNNTESTPITEALLGEESLLCNSPSTPEVQEKPKCRTPATSNCDKNDVSHVNEQLSPPVSKTSCHVSDVSTYDCGNMNTEHPSMEANVCLESDGLLNLSKSQNKERELDKKETELIDEKSKELPTVVIMDECTTASLIEDAQISQKERAKYIQSLHIPTGKPIELETNFHVTDVTNMCSEEYPDIALFSSTHAKSSDQTKVIAGSNETSKNKVQIFDKQDDDDIKENPTQRSQTVEKSSSSVIRYISSETVDSVPVTSPLGLQCQPLKEQKMQSSTCYCTGEETDVDGNKADSPQLVSRELIEDEVHDFSPGKSELVKLEKLNDQNILDTENDDNCMSKVDGLYTEISDVLQNTSRVESELMACNQNKANNNRLKNTSLYECVNKTPAISNVKFVSSSSSEENIDRVEKQNLELPVRNNNSLPVAVQIQSPHLPCRKSRNSAGNDALDLTASYEFDAHARLDCNLVDKEFLSGNDGNSVPKVKAANHKSKYANKSTGSYLSNTSNEKDHDISSKDTTYDDLCGDEDILPNESHSNLCGFVPDTVLSSKESERKCNEHDSESSVDNSFIESSRHTEKYCRSPLDECEDNMEHKVHSNIENVPTEMENQSTIQTRLSEMHDNSVQYSKSSELLHSIKNILPEKDVLATSRNFSYSQNVELCFETSIMSIEKGGVEGPNTLNSIKNHSSETVGECNDVLDANTTSRRDKPSNLSPDLKNTGADISCEPDYELGVNEIVHANSSITETCLQAEGSVDLRNDSMKETITIESGVDESQGLCKQNECIANAFNQHLTSGSNEDASSRGEEYSTNNASDRNASILGYNSVQCSKENYSLITNNRYASNTVYSILNEDAKLSIGLLREGSVSSRKTLLHTDAADIMDDTNSDFDAVDSNFVNTVGTASRQVQSLDNNIDANIPNARDDDDSEVSENMHVEMAKVTLESRLVGLQTPNVLCVSVGVDLDENSEENAHNSETVPCSGRSSLSNDDEVLSDKGSIHTQMKLDNDEDMAIRNGHCLRNHEPPGEGGLDISCNDEAFLISNNLPASTVGDEEIMDDSRSETNSNKNIQRSAWNEKIDHSEHSAKYCDVDEFVTRSSKGVGVFSSKSVEKCLSPMSGNVVEHSINDVHEQNIPQRYNFSGSVDDRLQVALKGNKSCVESSYFLNEGRGHTVHDDHQTFDHRDVDSTCASDDESPQEEETSYLSDNSNRLEDKYDNSNRLEDKYLLDEEETLVTNRSEEYLTEGKLEGTMQYSGTDNDEFDMDASEENSRHVRNDVTIGALNNTDERNVKDLESARGDQEKISVISNESQDRIPKDESSIECYSNEGVEYVKDDYPEYNESDTTTIDESKDENCYVTNDVALFSPVENDDSLVCDKELLDVSENKSSKGQPGDGATSISPCNLRGLGPSKSNKKFSCVDQDEISSLDLVGTGPFMPVNNTNFSTSLLSSELKSNSQVEIENNSTQQTSNHFDNSKDVCSVTEQSVLFESTTSNDILLEEVQIESDPESDEDNVNTRPESEAHCEDLQEQELIFEEESLLCPYSSDLDTANDEFDCSRNCSPCMSDSKIYEVPACHETVYDAAALPNNSVSPEMPFLEVIPDIHANNNHDVLDESQCDSDTEMPLLEKFSYFPSDAEEHQVPSRQFGNDSGTHSKESWNANQPEHKLDQSEDQLDQSVDQLNQSEDQLDQSEDQLDQSVDPLDQSEDQLDQSEDQLGQSEDQLDQSEDQLDQPEDQLDQPEDQLDQPEDQLDQPEDQLDQPEDQLDQPENQLDQPENQLDQPEVQCTSMNCMDIIPDDSVSNWPYLEEEVFSEVQIAKSPQIELPCSGPSDQHLTLSGLITETEDADNVKVPSVNTALGILSLFNRNDEGKGALNAEASDLKCSLSWKKIFSLAEQVEEQKKHQVTEAKNRKEAYRRWPCGKMGRKRQNVKSPNNLMNSVQNFDAECDTKLKRKSIDGLVLGPAKVQLRLGPRPDKWQVIDGSKGTKLMGEDNNNITERSCTETMSTQTPIVHVKRIILKRRVNENISKSISDGSPEHPPESFNTLTSTCSDVTMSSASPAVPSPVPANEATCESPPESDDSSTSVKAHECLPKVIIKRTGYGNTKYKSFLRLSAVEDNRWQPYVRLERKKAIDNLAKQLFGNNVSSDCCIIDSVKPSGLSTSKLLTCNECDVSGNDLQSCEVVDSTSNESLAQLGVLTRSEDLNEQSSSNRGCVGTYTSVKVHSKDTKLTIQLSNTSKRSMDIFDNDKVKQGNEIQLVKQSDLVESKEKHSKTAKHSKRRCSDSGTMQEKKRSVSKYRDRIWSEGANSDASKPKKRQLDNSVVANTELSKTKFSKTDLKAADFDTSVDEQDRSLEKNGNNELKGKHQLKQKFKIITCQACNFSVKNEAEKSAHIRQHQYHCQKCSVAFRSEDDFKSHLADAHPLTKELHHCLLCKLSFPSAEKHQHHLSERQHRHLDLTQRWTIQTLFKMFTGESCSRITPLTESEVAEMSKLTDAEPGAINYYHQATPLQIAVQELLKQSRKLPTTGVPVSPPKDIPGCQ